MSSVRLLLTMPYMPAFQEKKHFEIVLARWKEFLPPGEAEGYNMQATVARQTALYSTISQVKLLRIFTIAGAMAAKKKDINSELERVMKYSQAWNANLKAHMFGCVLDEADKFLMA